MKRRRTRKRKVSATSCWRRSAAGYPASSASVSVSTNISATDRRVQSGTHGGGLVGGRPRHHRPVVRQRGPPQPRRALLRRLRLSAIDAELFERLSSLRARTASQVRVDTPNGPANSRVLRSPWQVRGPGEDQARRVPPEAWRRRRSAEVASSIGRIEGAIPRRGAFRRRKRLVRLCCSAPCLARRADGRSAAGVWCIRSRHERASAAADPTAPRRCSIDADQGVASLVGAPMSGHRERNVSVAPALYIGCLPARLRAGRRGAGLVNCRGAGMEAAERRCPDPRVDYILSAPPDRLPSTSAMDNVLDCE